MTRPGAWIVAAAALVALPCRAQPGAGTGPTLPIVSVSLGRTPSADEVERVADAVGGPALPGEQLARALRLAAPSPEGEPAALAASHAAALEQFFAGDHAGAVAKWEALNAALDARPGLFADSPALLRIAFESRLCLALAARGAGDEEGVGRWLFAAARIEGLEPSAADYPPWIREELSRARARGVPKGRLSFVDAVDCELWIDGRLAGAGPGRYEAVRGRHAVSARCDGVAGVVREFGIGDAEVAVAPLVLRHARLARGGVVPIVEAEAGTTDDGLAADLYALGRAVGADRILALVGRPGGAELLLVDEGGIVRRSPVRGGDAGAIARAVDALAAPESRKDPAAPAGRSGRPWYEDGLAWGLAASGLAIWGAGLALGQTYGSNSPGEPFAWAMMAGGAVIAATGGVLFFVPAAAPSGDGGAAVGIAGGARF